MGQGKGQSACLTPFLPARCIVMLRKITRIIDLRNVSIGMKVLYKGKYAGVIVAHYHSHATVYFGRNKYRDMNSRNLHHYMKV